MKSKTSPKEVLQHLIAKGHPFREKPATCRFTTLGLVADEHPER